MFYPGDLGARSLVTADRARDKPQSESQSTRNQLSTVILYFSTFSARRSLEFIVSNSLVLQRVPSRPWRRIKDLGSREFSLTHLVNLHTSLTVPSVLCRCN